MVIFLILMANLKHFMPELNISVPELKKWGDAWISEVNKETLIKKKPFAFDKQQSVNFCTLFDMEVGKSLASMLGDIPVKSPKKRKKEEQLLPVIPDCVEVGPTKVIGGIRPQNYDVAYRPDGVRFAFDSKSLNDTKSVQKNWQNMINDLGTESATIHTRFPYAIVAFLVVIPRQALKDKQEQNIIRTLERLGVRNDVRDQDHLAESIGLIVWDPYTGEIDKNTPDPTSILRVENFSSKIHKCYFDRYKGLPPHD